MMKILDINEAIAIADQVVTERVGVPLRCVAAIRVAAEGDAAGHWQVTFLDDRPRPGLRGAPSPATVVEVGDDGATRCDA